MPHVTVSTIEGVNIETKRKLAEEMTQVVVNNINCPPEAVTVVIEERKLENVAHGGKLMADTWAK
jgi:4-oxalocrotonate tautomerase